MIYVGIYKIMKTDIAKK